MKPLKIETDPDELMELFCEKSFKDDYRILNREVRMLGYNIPPLVNAYMGLSPTMKMFGTATTKRIATKATKLAFKIKIASFDVTIRCVKKRKE
jgi:hypothetical protein